MGFAREMEVKQVDPNQVILLVNPVVGLTILLKI